MGFDGADLPIVVVGGVVDEALPGGENAEARLFDISCERAGVKEEVVGVAIDFAEGVFFAGFEADGVVVPVALTPCAVVEEVVADPEVGHGGLRRDGFYGGVGIDGGFDGEEAGIGYAHDADASVVVGDVLDEPGYGVVGVCGFIDAVRVRGCGIVVVDDGAVHDELSFGAEAAANVFHDEDVAALRELGVAGVEGVGIGLVDAVGRALHKDGQRLIGVSWAKDDGVQADAVAHGNHDLFAVIRAEVVVLGLVADAGGF